MKYILTALLAATFFLGGCSKSEQRHADEHKPAPVVQQAKPSGASTLHIEESMLRDVRVTTAAVELRTGRETTAMLGELRPNENAYAEVGAPIASRVVKTSVASGQTVSAGQVLATLQSSEVGKARAEAITAQARLALANKILERKRRLGVERIVAQREIQEAEANLETATADLRAAKTTLRALGVDGSESEVLSDSPNFSLRSPISGTVIEREAIQGQLAEPSKPLFRVGSLGRLWLTVHAFERDAVRVKPGSAARVEFAALPGLLFKGQVTLVGKRVEPDSRTVPVRVEIENPNGVLRPGMSATAWILVGYEIGEILAVPAAALQRVGERWIVFIPRGESEFEMRAVGRGRDLGGEVEMVTGLKAGETVVVDGSFLLKAQAERARGEGGEHEH